MWKFTVHILLKPGLENFKHYFASMWDECNCAVLWTFFGITPSLGLEWKLTFPVLWPLLSFPDMLAYWVQHSHNIIFQIWNSSTGIPSPPLALFIVMLPEAHLTLNFRMSGSRWMITPSWLSGSWRSFLYSSSVYFCHLFLISSASVRSMPFLSFIVPIFAWNVPLVSLIFLKRSLIFPILLFSSISLQWSLRKPFLSLLAILWDSAFKWVYLSFSPLPLASLFFSAICKASSDNHFAFLHFLLYSELFLIRPWLYSVSIDQFRSVQSLSHVQLIPTPQTAAHQASIINSQSLLKLMSIEIGDAFQLSHPLSSPSPPTFNLSLHQGLFKSVSSLHQVAKVLDFQLQQQSFQWIFRTDSFRMNWLVLLAAQGTLKSLVQHHSSKASSNLGHMSGNFPSISKQHRWLPLLC